MISFADFQKIELRIGKVIEVEEMGSSKKLLKLKVDLGNEKRQIVAGIKNFYKPEELIGREIVLVSNLEPKVLAGIESQGMLLAAEDGERPVILIPEKEVPPGTKVG